MLTFVEDEKFTPAADRLLTAEEFFALLEKLARTPEAGVVLPRSGGCRKLRFAAKGKGARGGVRIIYSHHPQLGQIRLLHLYSKNEKEDLSASDIKRLQQKSRP